MKIIGLRLLTWLAAWVAVAAHAGPFAYMPGGNIPVIDADTRFVVQRIEVGGTPFGVAAMPSWPRAYVTNVTRNEIHVIDTAAQAVIANIAVAPFPTGIAMNAAGTRLYVVHDPTFFGGTGAASLTVVAADNMGIVGTVPLGAGGAQRIALNPAGTRAYVSNTSANTISIIDTASLAVVGTLAASVGPRGLAVDSTGRYLYVANYGSAAVVGNTVSVFDLAANTLAGTATVGFRPDTVALNGAGNRLWVTNFNSNTVTVLDTGSGAALATIPVGSGPMGIDLSPNGDFAYVGNFGSSSVSMISTSTLSVFHTLAFTNSVYAVGKFFGGNIGAAPQPPDLLSGLWWNAAESGWGLHLTQRRNTIFGAWFTYDAAGVPKWYVASNCQIQPPLSCPTCVEGAFCTGNLYEASGAYFFGTTFDPARVTLTNAGVMQLTFQNKDSATMTYAVGTRSRSVPITRQPLVPSATYFSDFTDLWWNPSESGWGLGITQQSGVMFIAWFVYDTFANPTWYVASDCRVTAAGNGCQGTLYRTSGPVGPTGSNVFDSSRLRVTSVGSITVTFTDANNGVMSYIVDSFAGTKSIQRQFF